MNTNKYLLTLMMGFSVSLINAEDKKEKKKPDETLQISDNLDVVNIYGDTITLEQPLTDQQGYDAVYDDSYSSDYVGKKRIEAYRGTTPSDLLSSFAGVYSGDSRNSGAIDPNIRGIQAEGRIKTRIDGTEQAVSVYRGYNGSSNRNYVDPMLTSSIRIIKDSGLDTGVHTGVGGGIEIRTLGVNDFIGDEGGFGGEVRIESSSNARKTAQNRSYNGYDLSDVPNYDPNDKRWDAHVINAYAQKHKQKGKGDQFNIFNGNDYAGRIAIGYKADNWDVIAALATRKRGNYFAGKHKKSFYNQHHEKNADYNFNKSVVSMAKYYKPGEDVLNTSSFTDSYLFKANWQPTDEQKLSFNIRRTKSLYGEIMPKQVHEIKDKGTQWPLSAITADAYSIQYKLNPKSTDYVDLKANIWMTKTNSDLYNSAGKLLRVEWGKTKVMDNARNFVNHTRTGFDVSNRFTINDKLNITSFGSFQNEKLNSRPKTWGPPSKGWAVYPRKGTRREFDLGINANWQVNKKLTLDIGAKYQAYRKHDSTLEKALNDPTNPYYSNYVNRARSIVEYRYNYSFRDPKAVADYLASPQYQNDVAKAKNSGTRHAGIWNRFCSRDINGRMCKRLNRAGLNRADFVDARIKSAIKALPNIKVRKTAHVAKWKRGANGKFNRKDSPCINGTIPNAPGSKGRECKIDIVNTTKTKPINHIDKKAHSWVPAIAANYQINDDMRVYARYNESVRFPSLFEGLIGAGGKDSPLGLLPEHSHKFEIGYVHNLIGLLPNAEAADFKVTYYQNKIINVIDRQNLNMKNFDEKSTKGLEFQGRYDTGAFFTDIGLSYMLENKMCDAESAALNEHYRMQFSNKFTGPLDPCSNAGLKGTYMASHAVPKLSTKLHIGARLLDRKLTLGSRITHYSAFDKSGYNQYMINTGLSKHNIVFNPPYGWDKTLIIDAYARYKINKNVMMELSGNNLTDQYYIDPATRTTMPAPGRTFKLGFTGKF